MTAFTFVGALMISIAGIVIVFRSLKIIMKTVNFGFDWLEHKMDRISGKED